MGLPDQLAAVQQRLHILQAEQSAACGGRGYAGGASPPTDALLQIAKGPAAAPGAVAVPPAAWLFRTAMDPPARGTRPARPALPCHALYVLACLVLEAVYLTDEALRPALEHVMACFTLPVQQPESVLIDGPFARLCPPEVWRALPKRALTLFNHHHVARVREVFAWWCGKALARRAEVAELPLGSGVAG
eukprot:TRINITY_DN8040_c0_g1_i1.p3 TRINITY_DN8040_c0_g1~~TRINITY_DN8040_c0_g1_i1.p3  ORF type:complete len:190 (+),score=63.93 TRINITY_DN8040_c0_g1_i1:1131-1700(+)